MSSSKTAPVVSPERGGCTNLPPQEASLTLLTSRGLEAVSDGSKVLKVINMLSSALQPVWVTSDV